MPNCHKLFARSGTRCKERMNYDRNQNRDKPQDERFLSGDLIFSLNLIKYSIDSEKKISGGWLLQNLVTSVCYQGGCCF